MSRILLIFFLTCGAAYAESPKQWLDDYFTVLDAKIKERVAFVASKKVALKPALEAQLKSYSAETAMYRYLFSYHIEHATGILKWNDGDWLLSIMVCNCGQEGCVPTPEFKKLFEARAEARRIFDEAFGEKIQDEISSFMSQMPKGWDDSYTTRISQLKDRFEALVKEEAALSKAVK